MPSFSASALAARAWRLEWRNWELYLVVPSLLSIIYLIILAYSISLPAESRQRRYMTDASTLAGEDVFGSFNNEITDKRIVRTFCVGFHRSQGSSPLWGSSTGGCNIDMHKSPFCKKGKEGSYVNSGGNWLENRSLSPFIDPRFNSPFVDRPRITLPACLNQISMKCRRPWGSIKCQEILISRCPMTSDVLATSSWLIYSFALRILIRHSLEWMILITGAAVWFDGFYQCKCL